MWLKSNFENCLITSNKNWFSECSIAFRLVGRMSRTTSAVVGSFVSDESEVSEVSKKKYDRNSISCLTGGGKLQMTNPTTPDLTPFQSSVQGNR